MRCQRRGWILKSVHHNRHHVGEAFKLILYLVELDDRYCCFLGFLVPILVYDLVRIGLLKRDRAFLGAVKIFLLKGMTTK